MNPTTPAPSVPPLSNRRLDDLLAVEDAYRKCRKVSPGFVSVVRMPEPTWLQRINPCGACQDGRCTTPESCGDD